MNKETQKEEELWDDFVKKSKKAQETLDYKDGAEARKSWAAFIGLYGGDNDPVQY